MKSILPVRYLLLIIAVAIPSLLEAQLSAPGVNAVRYTDYPSSPDTKDPVFIYCNISGSLQGSLDAVSPEGSPPFDYSWYKWDTVTKSFSEHIRTDLSVAVSSVTNLDEGGYRVDISGGYDTTLTGWIFMDKPYSSAWLQNYTCDYVKLNGIAAIDTFWYYDINDGVPVELPSGVSFEWSSDPVSAIPNSDYLIGPFINFPPLEDVTYKLEVSDSFGCISESSFFYESIHAKADFSVSPENGEAPLEVTFTDNSVGGSTYTWEFGDDSVSYLPDPEPHTYFKTGEYSAKLTVESEEGCIDTVRFNYIVVDPSELSIPNVFTPDGDGLNDYFIIESKSLRYVNVEVFSRNGLQVYSFFGEGERLREWKGWDGTINNSSRKATPGIYFYIINAYGWDDVVYDTKETRGFVYLYR